MRRSKGANFSVLRDTMESQFARGLEWRRTRDESHHGNVARGGLAYRFKIWLQIGMLAFHLAPSEMSKLRETKSMMAKV